MKRIALWFLSTLTVVVLLFGYHTSTSRVLASSATTSIVSGTAATATTQESSGSGAASSTPSSTPTASGSGTTRKTTPTSTPTSTPTATTSTVTGSAADTRYGPVQVQLTVTDGTITQVSVPEYPNSDGRDAEINSYALPQLIQETLDAQSAQIDMVSGATFTSEGYLQSLQSALDQADL